MYIADGDFIKDIEVNDLRNRYMLTKGATQKMVIYSTPSTDSFTVRYPSFAEGREKKKASHSSNPLVLLRFGLLLKQINAYLHCVLTFEV